MGQEDEDTGVELATTQGEETVPEAADDSDANGDSEADNGDSDAGSTQNMKDSNLTGSMRELEAMENKVKAKGKKGKKAKRKSVAVSKKNRANYTFVQLYARSLFHDDRFKLKRNQHILAVLYKKTMIPAALREKGDPDGPEYIKSSACETYGMGSITRFGVNLAHGDSMIRIVYKERYSQEEFDALYTADEVLFMSDEEVAEAWWKPIGSFEMDLDGEGGMKDDIVNEINIKSATGDDIVGMARVHAEEIESTKIIAKMKFSIAGYDDGDGYAHFLQVFKLVPKLESKDEGDEDDDDEYAEYLVHRSPTPRNNNKWDTFSVPLRRLCNGNVDAPIMIRVMEHHVHDGEDSEPEILDSSRTTDSTHDPTSSTLLTPRSARGAGKPEDDEEAKKSRKKKKIEEAARKRSEKERERGIVTPQVKKVGQKIITLRELMELAEKKNEVVADGEPKKNSFELEKSSIAEQFVQPHGIRIRVQQAQMEHFVFSSEKEETEYHGLKVLPPQPAGNDALLDIEDLKRQKRDGKEDEPEAPKKKGKLALMREDFKIWLQTKPLERALNKLPIMNTVVEIGMRFSTSTEAFFSFYAFLIGLNLATAILWIVLVVFPYMSAEREVETSAGVGDFLAAFTIFRKPEGGETLFGTWYGDYDDTVALNWVWATVGSVLLTFFITVTQARAVFDLLDGQPTKAVRNKCKFSFALFGGWEYTCGSKTLREALKSGITLTLKSLLTEEDLAKERRRIAREMSPAMRRLLYARRAFFLLFSVSFAVTTIGIIYIVATETSKVIEFGIDKLGESRGPMLPSLLVKISTGIVGPIIKFSVKMEKWNNPAIDITQIIYRTFMVKAMIIETLYFSQRVLTTTLNVEGEGTYKCNQDMIANAFLKLLWMDIIVDVGSTLAGPIQIFIKRALKTRSIKKKMKKQAKAQKLYDEQEDVQAYNKAMTEWQDAKEIAEAERKPEPPMPDIAEPEKPKILEEKIFNMPNDFAKAQFNLPDSVIMIVYRQMMVWIGTPFCPIITMVAFVGYCVVFQARAFALLNFFRPNPIPWDPIDAQMMMLKVTFLAACFCLIPTVHFLTSDFAREMYEDTSGLQLCCGPHLPYNQSLIFNGVDPTGRDGYVCIKDGVPLTSGSEVLSSMLVWNDVSDMGQFLIKTGLSPVVLLVMIMFTVIAVSLLQKALENAKEQIEMMELEAEITAQNTFNRLSEIGMLHLME